jgi:hypothetical protein
VVLIETTGGGVFRLCPDCAAYVAPLIATLIGASACPRGCRNTDSGTCPRCFIETGQGCGHGPLCADCQAQILPNGGR